VTAATWYLWDNGRVLVNMDEGRKRLQHMRSNPQVSLTVLDAGDWYTTDSVIMGVSCDPTRQETGIAYRERCATRSCMFLMASVSADTPATLAAIPLSKPRTAPQRGDGFSASVFAAAAAS
jgi:hypothetical protein